MTTANCNLIGETSGTAVVADICDLNCSDYISATASDPSIDYDQAYSCCILEHEVSHVADTECPDITNSACREVPAYSQSLSCIQEVGIAVCAAFPDSPECRQACGSAAAFSASITLHACLCTIGYPYTDILSCESDCKSNTSPDDLPYNCPSIIDVDFAGTTTSGTHTDVIDDICENAFSSSSSSSSSTSSSEESSSSSSDSSSSEPAPPPVESSSSESSSSESSSSSSVPPTPTSTPTAIPSISITPTPTSTPTARPSISITPP